MAKNRLKDISEHAAPHHHAIGHEVIPFPGYGFQFAPDNRKNQSIWSIMLQTAMIPLGMAAILFVFLEATAYYCSCPLK